MGRRGGVNVVRVCLPLLIHMLHAPIQLSLQNKFRDQIMKNLETVVLQTFTRLGAPETPQVTAMKLALDSLISLFHPVHL